MPRPGSFTWDARTSRYRRPNGRFVPRTEVRRVLDVAVDRAGERMATLTAQLRDRQIPLAEWQRGMREAIKDSHNYAAAAARGGWAQMNAADRLRAGREIGRQYRYLQRLATDIAAGRVPLDGRLAMRAKLYGRAARATYHDTERAEMGERNGMTEERNILAPADHCDSCLAETARGWVEIGALSLPGSSDRTCRQNCKCQLEYRAA